MPTGSKYDIPDGCSGFIETYYKRKYKKNSPFFDCCNQHDQDYADGGFNPINRWKADWNFLKCIWNECNHNKLISIIYFLIVFLCGWFSFYFIKGYYIFKKKFEKEK